MKKAYIRKKNKVNSQKIHAQLNSMLHLSKGIFMLSNDQRIGTTSQKSRLFISFWLWKSLTIHVAKDKMKSEQQIPS